MKKTALLLFMVQFAVNTIWAQRSDSLRYKYTNQTIYRHGGYFLKGTERLTFQDLSNEFSMSDFGLASYTKARQYKTTSLILRFASLACSIAVLAVVTNDNNNTRNRRNLAYGLLGGQIVFGFGSGKFSQLSAQSVDRALWERNKDVLFPAR